MRSSNNSNPYAYLEDDQNAIKEFYKLKQRLCLTDEERQALNDCMNSDRIFIGGFNDKHK